MTIDELTALIEAKGTDPPKALTPEEALKIVRSWHRRQLRTICREGQVVEVALALGLDTVEGGRQPRIGPFRTYRNSFPPPIPETDEEEVLCLTSL